MQWIITYDIVNDKVRRQVVKILTAYSLRVQKSVFEGQVKQKSIDELMAKLEKVIKMDEDSIRCYQVCQKCEEQIRIIGIGEKSRSVNYMII